MACAFVADVRRESHYSNSLDDRRSRQADSNAPNRRVLRCAQNAWSSDRDSAVQRRIPWDRRPEAVQLHQDAAIHDELVQEVFAICGRQSFGHRKLEKLKT